MELNHQPFSYEQNALPIELYFQYELASELALLYQIFEAVPFKYAETVAQQFQLILSCQVAYQLRYYFITLYRIKHDEEKKEKEEEKTKKRGQGKNLALVSFFPVIGHILFRFLLRLCTEIKCDYGCKDSHELFTSDYLHARQHTEHRCQC